jgi:FkbM family methyltransferase
MAAIRAGIAKTILVAVGFIPGLVLGIVSFPAVRDILGRSSGCSLLEAPSGLITKLRRMRAMRDARVGNTLLKSDGQGFEYWSTAHGAWWIPKNDGPNLALVTAEQELDIYSSQSNRVRQGDVVLDCGAHIGAFTRNALKKGALKVIAVEPAPENVECLRRNFAAELASGRVILYPKGVWDRQDTLTLAGSGSAQHEIGAQGDACSIKVPLVTIDALVEELGLDRLDFVKMDIEGAEERALKGAKMTLTKFKPRLAIAGYHNLDDYRTLARVVSEASPAYRMTCGPCYSARGMRPETLFFQ